MLAACLAHCNAVPRVLASEQHRVDRRVVHLYLVERAPHDLLGAGPCFRLALISRDTQRSLGLADATELVPCATATDEREYAGEPHHAQQHHCTALQKQYVSGKSGGRGGTHRRCVR